MAKKYLLGWQFRIFTDQKSLKHLLSQVVQTPDQYKRATKLIGYDFEIFYKPGKEHKAVNSLSRIEEVQLLALSSTNPTWWTNLQEYYKSPHGQRLITKLLNSDTSLQLREGHIYNSTKLFIANNAIVVANCSPSTILLPLEAIRVS